MESATDRTETRALVDNKIQASPKDILIQLSIHLSLTVFCIIGLTIGGISTNAAVTVTEAISVQISMVELHFSVEYSTVHW